MLLLTTPEDVCSALELRIRKRFMGWITYEGSKYCHEWTTPSRNLERTSIFSDTDVCL
jgi:hypothetical protein